MPKQTVGLDHLDEFKVILHTHSAPHTMIGISETWLSESNEFLSAPKGFQSVPVSGEYGSGGDIAIYIPLGMEYHVCSDLSSFYF